MERDHASMGPRSRERGNQVRIAGQGSDCGRASMGPRSRERGNVNVGTAIESPVRASMGPRSRERGNPAARRSSEASLSGFNGAALT